MLPNSVPDAQLNTTSHYSWHMSFLGFPRLPPCCSVQLTPGLIARPQPASGFLRKGLIRFPVPNSRHGFILHFCIQLLICSAAEDFQPDGDASLQKPEACSPALLYVSTFLILRNKFGIRSRNREVDFITQLLSGSTKDYVCSRMRSAQAALDCPESSLEAMATQ